MAHKHLQAVARLGIPELDRVIAGAGRQPAAVGRELVHHTRRILQFLTYSERPLRLEEAVDMIAVDTGKDMARGRRFDPNNRLPVPKEIARVCSSLVVVVSRQGGYGEEQEVTEIQLAHFSVKDYLTSDRLESQTFQYLEETAARSSITGVCLAYLLEFRQVKTAKEIKQVFPFAQYSARYWLSHAIICEQKSEYVFELTKQLFFNRKLLERLPRCGRMLLDQGADVNAQGGSYGNALQAA
ncbi:hypothetical protein G7054_g13309 [Neopestalotiopsis clavispora]|nr:hypothetical protein G7054_g13309 [Neopestalotiopsis clavispora]